jgi:ribosomal protein L7/L12
MEDIRTKDELITALLTLAQSMYGSLELLNDEGMSNTYSKQIDELGEISLTTLDGKNGVDTFLKKVILDDSSTRNVKVEALEHLIQMTKSVVIIDKNTTIPTSNYNTIISFLAQGKKIRAIKHLREITGYGLRESKEICDVLQSNLQIKG